MEEIIEKFLDNYAIDLLDELDISPFEYTYMLQSRTYIAENYYFLNTNQKEKLKKYDYILIQRAEEFYKYLLPTKVWGNSDTPIKYWWWHLDKIISNKLKVDFTNNEIIYNGEKIKMYKF